jgi:hypothetical protein
MKDDPIPDLPGAPVGRASRASSVGALMCLVLGCLVIGGTLVNAYEVAWPFALSYRSWSAGIMLYAGPTSIGLLLGIALLVAAHGACMAARRSRLKLWAKLLIVFGLMPSVGFPLMAYGTLLLRALVGEEPIGSYEYPNVFDSSLFTLAIEMTVVPIVLGLIVIVAAIIWGRRRKAPDVSHVFS